MKEKILTIAETYFTRYGIKSVTMDDLCKEMGISKKTLYQFFDNKDTLVEEVFEIHHARDTKTLLSLNASAKDAIEEIIIITKFNLATLRNINPSAVFDLQKYYKGIWGKIEAYHNTYAFEAMKKNLSRGVEQGLYRSDLNIELVAKMYVNFATLLVEEDKFPYKNFGSIMISSCY